MNKPTFETVPVTFESDKLKQFKKKRDWVECNACFDGDHKECVDVSCECPCKPRNRVESDKWREVFKRKFTYMGRNQADQLDRQFNQYTHPDEVMECISILLSEERKRLITELPEDLKTFVRMSIDNNWQFTEEQVIKAEVAWNKLMESKLKEERNKAIQEMQKAYQEDHDRHQRWRQEQDTDLRNKILDKAWGYVVKASREEHGSKEEFIKYVNS